MFDPEVLWETDPPPVHFWWYSEGSIRAIVTEDDFDCVDDTPKKAK